MKPSALITVVMEHPLALQLRNLESLLEIGVDKDATVASGALMSTLEELRSSCAGGARRPP